MNHIPLKTFIPIIMSTLLLSCGENMPKPQETTPHNTQTKNSESSFEENDILPNKEVDDRSLFEVKYDVKCVKTITSHITDKAYLDIDTTSVQFYENGLVSNINFCEPVDIDPKGNPLSSQYELARNQEGRINSYFWTVLATPETYTKMGYEYLYNENGQLSKMISHGIESRSEYTYEYDGNGRTSKIEVKGCGEGSRWEYSFNYEYLAVDHKGNWILATEKATYSTMDSEENPLEQNKSYNTNIISRDIEYYSDNHDKEDLKELRHEIKKKINEIYAFTWDDGNHFLSKRLRKIEQAEHEQMFEGMTEEEHIVTHAERYLNRWTLSFANNSSFKLSTKLKSLLISSRNEVFATIILSRKMLGDKHAILEPIIFKFIKEDNKWVVDDYFNSVTAFESHLDLSRTLVLQPNSFIKKVSGDFYGDGSIEGIWVYNPKYEKDGKTHASRLYIYNLNQNIKTYESDTNHIVNFKYAGGFINDINVQNLGDINGNGSDELGILYHNEGDEENSHFAILTVNSKGEWKELIKPVPLYESALTKEQKIVNHSACQPGSVIVLSHEKTEKLGITKVYKKIFY